MHRSGTSLRTIRRVQLLSTNRSLPSSNRVSEVKAPHIPACQRSRAPSPARPGVGRASLPCKETAANPDVRMVEIPLTALSRFPRPALIAQLESQTVCAANEAIRAGHHYEALATKLRKDRPRCSQVNHGSAPSLIGLPRVGRVICRSCSKPDKTLSSTRAFRAELWRRERIAAARSGSKGGYSMPPGVQPAHEPG
jgi:hypothetical protein